MNFIFIIFVRVFVNHDRNALNFMRRKKNVCKKSQEEIPVTSDFYYCRVAYEMDCAKQQKKRVAASFGTHFAYYSFHTPFIMSSTKLSFAVKIYAYFIHSSHAQVEWS